MKNCVWFDNKKYVQIIYQAQIILWPIIDNNTGPDKIDSTALTFDNFAADLDQLIVTANGTMINKSSNKY